MIPSVLNFSGVLVFVFAEVLFSRTFPATSPFVGETGPCLCGPESGVTTALQGFKLFCPDSALGISLTAKVVIT